MHPLDACGIAWLATIRSGMCSTAVEGLDPPSSSQVASRFRQELHRQRSSLRLESPAGIVGPASGMAKCSGGAWLRLARQAPGMCAARHRPETKNTSPSLLDLVLARFMCVLLGRSRSTPSWPSPLKSAMFLPSQRASPQSRRTADELRSAHLIELLAVAFVFCCFCMRARGCFARSPCALSCPP